MWHFTEDKKLNKLIDPNFQTPEIVCEYMAGLIPAHVKTICEPTPGFHQLVNVLQKKNKYDITAPDDFFAMDHTQHFDCIVMNPPFGTKWAFNVPENVKETGMRLGYYFLTECMKMSDNVIALMPWFTISDSDVRLRHLNEFGIRSITTLPRKTFKYARIQTVVIHLQKGYNKTSQFKIFQF